MPKRALLLNSNYEVLSFISERKVCKFLYKEKAEPISFWDDTLFWGNEEIHLPSVLVLKSEIKYRVSRIHFSRKLLIKRDKNQCQYCGVKIYGAQITMDHILPKSRGGKTSFLNCVLACHDCNNSKNDDTPEEAGMKLLSNPINPIFTSKFYVSEDQEFWHESWNSFFTH